MDRIDNELEKIDDPKMLLVTDVVYRIVPVNVSAMYEFKYTPPEHSSIEEEKIDDIIKHITEGETYYSIRRGKICLGYTKKVQKLLGIPLEEIKWLREGINNISRHEKYIKKEYMKKERELGEFRNMSFWQRLKFLFKGVR